MQYSRDCITITSNNLFFHFQKHPHLRGENLHGLRSTFSDWETSPPAWGKQMREVSARNASRNIPTCVGKTHDEAHLSRKSGKHPHLRGENEVKAVHDVTKLETSPPAWGKREVSSPCGGCFRNIPTCVGKTFLVPCFCVTSQKHPHLRGENSRTRPWQWQVPETSPPAWGKPAHSGNLPNPSISTSVSEYRTS